MGKVCVAKTFLISQWVYIMQVIVVPEKVIAEVNRLMYVFLWKKKNNNRKAFEKEWRLALEANKNIDFWQDTVEKLIIKKNLIKYKFKSRHRMQRRRRKKIRYWRCNRS